MQKEMKAKAEKMLADPNITLLEKLRNQCLARGASGIKGLGRTFKIMDDDGNKQISFPEFKKGLHDYGCDVTASQSQELFSDLDKDGSGALDFDEFLIALRPPMSKYRTGLIRKAFTKLDKTQDGEITVDDLKGVYDPKHAKLVLSNKNISIDHLRNKISTLRQHKKYKSGEYTEDDVFLEFLKSFDTPGEADGIVTRGILKLLQWRFGFNRQGRIFRSKRLFYNYDMSTFETNQTTSNFNRSLLMTNAWKL